MYIVECTKHMCMYVLSYLISIYMIVAILPSCWIEWEQRDTKLEQMKNIWHDTCLKLFKLNRYLIRFNLSIYKLNWVCVNIISHQVYYSNASWNILFCGYFIWKITTVVDTLSKYGCAAFDLNLHQNKVITVPSTGGIICTNIS